MNSHAAQERVPLYAQTEDPRWQLVERILNTEDFLRAPRLAEFLRYVCQTSLSGRDSELHEQHIGEVVFGRTPEYDSSADTVVRSNALRLRRRLEKYFLYDGRKESLRLEIPRGGYVPRFYAAEKTADPVSNGHGQVEKLVTRPLLDIDTPLSSSREGGQDKWTHRKRIKFFLAGLSFALLAMGVARHLRHDASVAAMRSGIKQTPIEQRFWNSLFPTNGKTIIVLGDSGLVLYETVTGQEVTLSNYLGGAYRDPSRVPRNSSEIVTKLCAF